MIITSVLLEANTPYEIFFLLTAYIDAVRHFKKPGRLPEELTSLPLSGVDDVRARLEILSAELEARSPGSRERDSLALKEAVDVFGGALRRLQSLGEDRV